LIRRLAFKWNTLLWPVVVVATKARLPVAAVQAA
jgi:hypothetical protein